MNGRSSDHTTEPIVYLNNAASSFPKPDEVCRAVAASMHRAPCLAGRCPQGDDVLDACRREAAALLGVASADHVVLLPSATHALNLVFTALCHGPGGTRGGHGEPSEVVTTDLEHNSVLRPLAHLGSAGAVRTRFVAPGADGQVDPQQIVEALGPTTALVCVTHASNVTGCVQPVEQIARAVAAHGVPLLIDAAQSAGSIPLTHRDLAGRVFVAAAGHKGLLGPTGTGLLVVPDDRLPQTLVGGTGVRSDVQLHPPELPLRHEAGTPNVVGCAGLLAGMRYVRAQGVEQLGKHRQTLVHALREGLSAMTDVWLSPLAAGDGRAGVVSFTRTRWAPDEMAYLLQEGFSIVTRAGLHCAPRAHIGLGTSAAGTLRLSVGVFNTLTDVGRLLAALQTMGAR